MYQNMFWSYLTHTQCRQRIGLKTSEGQMKRSVKLEKYTWGRWNRSKGLRRTGGCLQQVKNDWVISLQKAIRQLELMVLISCRQGITGQKGGIVSLQATVLSHHNGGNTLWDYFLSLPSRGFLQKPGGAVLFQIYQKEAAVLLFKMYGWPLSASSLCIWLLIVCFTPVTPLCSSNDLLFYPVSLFALCMSYFFPTIILPAF